MDHRRNVLHSGGCRCHNVGIRGASGAHEAIEQEGIMLKWRYAFAGALALASIGPVSAATPKDTLVMAWNLDALITFDPAQIAEIFGNDIIRNVCDPLVEFKLDDVSKLEPKTAESWSVSPDGLKITFKLRPDLQFPSGKKATAHDLAWSMHRVLYLGFGASANLTQWGFAKDKAEQQIVATDDHTLVVNLDKPYPPQLLLAAAFANQVTQLLDREEGMKNAKTADGRSDYGNAFFKTAPICVGPYKVRTWNANDVVILERNDNYYGQKPHLRRVIIRHVPESGAQRLQLEKGDIDVARLLNSDDLKAVSTSKDIHLEKVVFHGYTYLAFNTQDPILSNPKVRLAFRYLIDYDGLGKTVIDYWGVPRASLVPIGAYGALDEKEGQPFKLDLDRAKQILTEAGYPQGFTKKFILSANTPNPPVAQHIAANAAKVGIKLELEQMADANLFTKARSRDFDVLQIGWGAGYPDADSMISRHAVNPDNRAEAKLAQYPSWRSSWQDQKINDMAEVAKMERDPAKRVAMYHEIQRYMMENGPMAYIYQTVWYIPIRNEVKGFMMNAFHRAYNTAQK
jgi:peptide/nickel transport system substrate-binding protein